jgi:hypothetical protein
MTSNAPDVDRIVELMLDDPAPPLPTAHEVLASARRAYRRRTAFAVAGSGLAVTAVVATIAAGVTLTGSGAADPSRAAGELPAAAPPQQPLPVAPGMAAARAHGTRNAAIIMAAIPPGLTGVVQQASANSPAATWQWDIRGKSRYGSMVDVVVTDGRADGMITVTLEGELTGLGTDLCAQVVTDLLQPGPPGCEIVTVNGIPIRVVTMHDDRGEVNLAIRLLDGGLLFVQAQQGIPAVPADDHVPPDITIGIPDGNHTSLGGSPALAAAPMTKAQVAALAADPDLLP